MPDYKEILYEKQRGGALITLNRPEAMNAISRSMIKEIHQALDDVEQDREVRAVVLTGAGRAFSAGMDQGDRAGTPPGYSLALWHRHWTNRRRAWSILGAPIRETFAACGSSASRSSARSTAGPWARARGCRSSRT